MRRLIRLESLLLAGAAVALAGFACSPWRASTSRVLDGLADEKLAVVGLTVFVVGVQVVFASFLLSVLGPGRRRSEALPVAALADDRAEAPQPLPVGELG